MLQFKYVLKLAFHTPGVVGFDREKVEVDDDAGWQGAQDSIPPTVRDRALMMLRYSRNRLDASWHRTRQMGWRGFMEVAEYCYDERAEEVFTVEVLSLLTSTLASTLRLPDLLKPGRFQRAAFLAAALWWLVLQHHHAPAHSEALPPPLQAEPTPRPAALRDSSLQATDVADKDGQRQVAFAETGAGAAGEAAGRLSALRRPSAMRRAGVGTAAVSLPPMVAALLEAGSLPSLLSFLLQVAHEAATNGRAITAQAHKHAHIKLAATWAVSSIATLLEQPYARNLLLQAHAAAMAPQLEPQAETLTKQVSTRKGTAPSPPPPSLVSKVSSTDALSALNTTPVGACFNDFLRCRPSCAEPMLLLACHRS